MKLGFTTFNYARSFGEPRRDAAGQPPLYFPYQRERIPTEESLAWGIRKARSLNVQVVADPLARWQEPGFLDAMARLAEENGVAIEPWTVQDLQATGDEAKRAADRVIAYMRAVCRPLGARILGLGPWPMVYHRWVDSPSLDEQIARAAENLRPVARAAESEGITLALENHMDYWAAEYARIRDLVGSPAVRYRFDTANPFLIMEDPVRAVEVLADDVVTVHLKDVRIIPLCAEGAKVIGAPLGKGHVNARAILAILRARAPDPANLPLVIETHWVPPNEDPALWCDASVAWARENLREFLAPTTEET